jgi:hypothetical protein
VFGRKKAPEPAPVVLDRPGAKNRPTPTRRQAESQNRKPLVPTDRKAAAQAERARMREERIKARTALTTGDERHLPARDAGPVRRFVRDVVDGRWNVGEFYLVLALVSVGLTLLPSLLGQTLEQSARLQVIATLVLWGTVLVCATDAFVLSRILRRRLVERFGDEVVIKGNVSYGVLRSFQLRRLRLPKPQVTRGQPPR